MGKAGSQTISAGYNHTVVIKNRRQPSGVGTELHGQLGDGSSGGDEMVFSNGIDKNSPVKIMTM
jgi:alpha-tubulin suppressor-like RCC1 family protein